MLRKIGSKQMGRSESNELKSLFHFSFAEYYNPQNMNFGVLRVINDDLINPGVGFPLHPHRDMEIITYVVNGYLTHGDSMGNLKTIGRGDFQYMSAGTGVRHSEYNNSSEILRLLQIWILPEKKGLNPQYKDMHFDKPDRHSKWLKAVSKDADAPLPIQQNADIYVSELDKNDNISFNIGIGSQAYLVQIEGKSNINGIELSERDALEVIEENINIDALEDSHFLLIEMNKA